MRDSLEFAAQIRANAIEMVTTSLSSHIGSALSIADVVAVLYSGVMRFESTNPELDHRDRFILSKGHACSIVYAALAELSFFDKEELRSYAQPGARLLAHISHRVPGVEFSTGSLGHGLPFGVGKALTAQQLGADWQTYVIVGDGELAEGSNWESLLFAAHHELNNLTAIIDANNLQSLTTVEKTLNLEPLEAKLTAFGVDAIEVDGHDHAALRDALTPARARTPSSQPRVIIARTIKGKGVSFMENQVAWHYKSPTPEQMRLAFDELGFL